MNILECLCNRPNDNEYRKTVHGELRVGLEHICKVIDGKGSCGLDFYEDDDEPCQWCCQILRLSDEPKEEA